MDRKIKRASNNELFLMEALWEGTEYTIEEFYNYTNGEYSKKSISTMLGRLKKKGLVDFHWQGKNTYYFSTLNKMEYVDTILKKPEFGRFESAFTGIFPLSFITRWLKKRREKKEKEEQEIIKRCWSLIENAKKELEEKKMMDFLLKYDKVLYYIVCSIGLFTLFFIFGTIIYVIYTDIALERHMKKKVKYKKLENQRKKK